MSFGDRALRKQLAAADRAGARFALVVGDESGLIGVKDLRSGEQRDMPQDDVVRVLRDEYAKAE
jgi:histidyl-tRNA synthetase